MLDSESFVSNDSLEQGLHEPPANGEAGQSPSCNLLNELASGAIGPLSRLQETIDLTLEQLADWIGQPRNRRQIGNLVALLDAQAQLIICQHRVIAVARLAEVAATAQSPETVRRACANLLRIRLIDPYKEDVRPEPPPLELEQKPLWALSHERIRAVFEDMAKRDAAD